MYTQISMHIYIYIYIYMTNYLLLNNDGVHTDPKCEKLIQQITSQDSPQAIDNYHYHNYYAISMNYNS